MIAMLYVSNDPSALLQASTNFARSPLKTAYCLGISYPKHRCGNRVKTKSYKESSSNLYFLSHC
jgi:hypothetical protein